MSEQQVDQATEATGVAGNGAGADGASPDARVSSYGRDIYNDFDLDDPEFNEHF